MADWVGADYRRLSRLQDAVAAEALAELVLRGDEAVLDVGCGDGRRTAEIAQRVPRGRVLGIDASPRMIEAAADLRRPGLDYACIRVQDLDADGEFDVVVSLNALHWVPAPQWPDVLQRLHRALRPGGSALLQFVCAPDATAPDQAGPEQTGPDQTSVEQTGMDVAASPRWRQWFTGFAAPFTHPQPQAFADQAADAGFRVRRSSVQRHEWPFPDREAFAQWTAVGFGDWTARLPGEAEAGQFVREVVDTYADRTGTDAVFRFMQLRAMLEADGQAGE
jgi:trans-aconitate 2-methyltransferase